MCGFLAIRFSNVFLTNFQTFIFFAPKSRDMTSQKSAISQFVLPESDFLSPDDVELMSGESCQVSCRYRLGFRIYSGKTEGAYTPPPRRLRVNETNTVGSNVSFKTKTSKKHFGQNDLLNSGDLNFDLRLKMTEVVSELFLRTFHFRFPFCSTMRRSRDRREFQASPHQVV